MNLHGLVQEEKLDQTVNGSS